MEFREKVIERRRSPTVVASQSRPPAANRQSNMILNTLSRPTLGRKNAEFIRVTSFGQKSSFPLAETTTIGRNNSNDIVLTDPKISKSHAVVVKRENEYFIKDLNSSNGITINNLAIQTEQFFKLSHLDKVDIGSITLTFQENSTLSTIPVTILPSERQYEDSVTIATEIEQEDVDFKKVDEVSDLVVLKEDYEKLRLAYEVSKISVADDITPLLAKSIDLLFDLLPIDRGVVLLLDEPTGNLLTHYVKLRQGTFNEGRPIPLSSTILRKVFDSRVSLISRDAVEDPVFKNAASIRVGQIRSVICVPLVSHDTVHGIIHLDSRDKLNSSFGKKDLALVKSIANQTSIALENIKLVKEVANKARITEQLSRSFSLLFRFLAPHVVDRMTNGDVEIQRGGREILGTIVFTDIRGFTNLSENKQPAEVVNMLNDFFERLVKIVFKYEGVVDKYIGDALMATFGTLGETDAEYRSVATSLEFIAAIGDMNAERARRDQEPIKIGVGVNTGFLVAGFIGSSQRLEYTCIGDTVNTSSRICDLAKSNEVLVSETTYEKIKDRVHAVEVGPRMFKGKKKEVLIYNVLSLRE